MPFSTNTLSKIAVKQGILEKKVAENLEGQAKEDGEFYPLLLKESKLTKEALNAAIAKEFNVQAVDLSKYTISSEQVKMIPDIVAQKSKAVVFARDQNGIHLAIDNPDDTSFVKNFQKRMDAPVSVYFADTASIEKVLNEHRELASETLKQMIDEITTQEGVALAKPEDIPIIKIVDKLLEFGYVNKTSDIHIEPHEDNTLVRFRIDGILHDIVTIPKNLHTLVVMRIKILSRLRTDEHRAAQDGKLTFIYNKERVDVRVSILPIVRGEKIVMRLLSEKSKEYDLENLGFRPEDLEKIRNNIDKPWGLILSTGPTGCGKTTSLYSILKILNTREVNISTIEDPVEYDMEGINQIQVDPNTNLTFALGLRAIVRQDPNIIMIGEIRDTETAKIAINSAMTGHLVLSTLHTNDAATTLPRLLDMGVQSFLVASTVNLIIGQRLLRKICENCRENTTLTEDHVALLEKQFSAELLKKYNLATGAPLFKGKGCTTCQHTGYKGRVGIFEILEMSEDIRKMVVNQVDANQIKQKAVELGMLNMVEDGIQKAQKGVTTIEEILRVTKE